MAGKIRRIITSPAGTLGMFALAVALLMFYSVGGARAALTYYSETYTSRVQMYDIGVTLLENEKEISWRNYDSRRDNGSWLEEKGELLMGRLDSLTAELRPANLNRLEGRKLSPSEQDVARASYAQKAIAELNLREN